MNNQLILATRTVARGQHGLFTLEQALELGWSPRTVGRWLRAGVWEEPAPRVYRFAGTPLSWKDELMAAVLSSSGIAARQSAAALFDLMPPPPKPHVLVARTRRNLERIVLHSSHDLPDSDTTRVGAIASTNPTRTVIDTAGDMKREAVERFVDRAVSRRLVRIETLRRRAEELRAPARPGANRVLRAIATAHPELIRTRNEFEAAVLRLCRSAGLPDPIPNYEVFVGGHRRFLDLAWPLPLVFIEYDGYLPHIESRSIFDDDRERQNDLVDADWTVFRFTAATLKNPRRTLEQVRRAVLGAESLETGVSA